MECGICIELVCLIKQLPCNHEICKNCYIKLYNNNCPFCRRKFIYSIDDIKQKKYLYEQNNNEDIEQLFYESITDIYNIYDIQINNNSINIILTFSIIFWLFINLLYTYIF